MNYEIEQEIIDQFIIKSLRPRTIFELKSAKKRNNCLWNLDTKFDNNYIIDVGKSVDSYKIIWEIFENNGAKSMYDCYLMSLDGNKIMPIEKALKENIFKGIFLVYWLKGKIAFWEGEQYSAPPIYILKNEIK